MQERMNRRGRIERIGQPHMQRKLRRFGHRADENQEADNDARSDGYATRPERYQSIRGCGSAKELLQLQCPKPRVSEDDCSEKSRVARALHDKCPKSATYGGHMLIVVGEERQKPAQQLPEAEEHQQIST